MIADFIGSTALLLFGLALSVLFARDVTRADDPPPFGLLATACMYVGASGIIIVVIRAVIWWWP